MNESTESFWLQVQQQIHKSIKFADTKAVQVIAIDVALLGAMYAIAQWDGVWLRCAALGVGLFLGGGFCSAFR